MNIMGQDQFILKSFVNALCTEYIKKAVKAPLAVQAKNGFVVKNRESTPNLLFFVFAILQAIPVTGCSGF